MARSDPPRATTVLRAGDLSRWQLRHLADTGDIERVRPGAYVPTDHDEGKWQRTERLAWARILAVADKLTADIVFSHETAALIHGLRVARTPELPHIIQRHKPHQWAGVTRHSDALSDGDVITIDGLPVTTLARTVSDCAKLLPARDGLVIADSALRRAAGIHRERSLPDVALSRVEALRARVDEHIEFGRLHGRPRARAVVGFADPLPESPRESIARWLALSRGMPPPRCQMPVRTTLGTFHADFGWRLCDLPGADPDDRRILLVEYDGESKYAGGDSLGPETDPRRIVAEILREKRRENAIREIPGAILVRLDRHDLRSADRAFARIAEHLPTGVRAALRARQILL